MWGNCRLQLGHNAPPPPPLIHIHIPTTLGPHSHACSSRAWAGGGGATGHKGFPDGPPRSPGVHGHPGQVGGMYRYIIHKLTLVIPDWVHPAIMPKDPLQKEIVSDAVRRETSTSLKHLLAIDWEFSREIRSRANEEDFELQVDKLRRANREFLISLDNQLRKGCGLSIMTFVPPRRLASLGADETRVFVKRMCPLTNVVRRRSCIKNVLTGEKQYELPLVVVNGTRTNNTWHCRLDCGSIGDPAVNWIFRDLGAKGTHLWDRLHRIVCDWLDGLSEAGLTGLRFDWSAVLSCRKGPFGKQANHRILVAVAKYIFENLTSENPAFDHLYPAFCDAFHMRDDVDYGGDAHRQIVWSKCKSLLCGTGMGQSLKHSRWWSTEERAISFFETKAGIPGLLLIITVLGHQRKWWSTLQKSPLWSHFNEEFPAGDDDEGDAVSGPAAEQASESDGDGDDQDGGGDDGDACDKRLSVGKARLGTAAKRRNSLHTLHFVSQVISKPLGCRLFKGSVYLPEKIRESFKEEMELMKTRRGGAHLHSELQQGSYIKVMHATLQHFFSAEFASFVGCSFKPRPPALLVEDGKVVRGLARLVVRAVASMALTNFTYMMLPPLSLLGLINPSSDVVKSELELNKKGWAVLQLLEATALTNNMCRSFVMSLRFPCEQFCREVYVRLDEDEFKSVSTFVRDDLYEFSVAPTHTLLIENCGNLGRRIEKKNGAGKASPQIVWHRMSTSKLLPDFDVPIVPQTNAAIRAAAPSIGDGVFFAKPEDCSVPDTLLDRIHDVRPNWPTQSALNRRLAAIRWACALEFDGDWDAIESTYWSVVMMPQTFVRKTGDLNTYFFVLMSSPHGFLGWRFKPSRLPNGHLSLALTSPSKDSVCIQVVRDVAQWDVVPVESCSPGHAIEDPKGKFGGIRFILTGAPKPLLPYLCATGLRDIPVEILKKMHVALAVPLLMGKRPTTRAELSKTIVRHVMTDFSEEQVLEACLRATTDADEFDSCVTGIFDREEIDLVLEEFADENLIDEITKLKAKAKSKALAREKQKIALVKAAIFVPGAAASSGHVDEPQPLYWIPGRGLLQSEARFFLPPSATLRKDEKRDPRWQVRAPYINPSYSRKYQRGDSALDNDALLSCLRHAWLEYTRQFDKVCPWVLELPD
jgi:hypothetical protein